MSGPSYANIPVLRECQAGRFMRDCADAWQGAFDVLVDREMTHAVLTYDGETICGYAAGTMEIVPAGERVTFTAKADLPV